MNSVVIAGARGFMGSHLRRAFELDGIEVRTIGRTNADACWGHDLRGVLEGADAVINLAGRSVSCRYNKRNADAIFASRTETTAELGEALAACDVPPPVWLNSSTGTIYRDARDRPQGESTGELGSGFSVAVARAWEHEQAVAPTSVRKVALRTTIVLGANGGALNPLINMARLGCGGRQGDGTQIFSWIHVDDVYGAVRHLVERRDIVGPVNLASPHPVTNAQLMAKVREQFGRSFGLPLPAWMLDVGGRIIGTEAELVLKSRWVAPEKLLDSGYQFRFATMDDALADIARDTRRGLLAVPLG